MKLNKHSFHVTGKQWMAIMLIVVIGGILGALILTINKPAPEAGENAHAEAGHAERGAPHVEGFVAFGADQLRDAGIATETAGPAAIRNTLQLPGEIGLNEDRTAHVVPRLAGIAEQVSVSLGQQVKRGQVLAVIASTDLSDRRSELLTARKRLALAETTYTREKKLWEDRISAEQDYLQAQQDLREAEIALANAQQKLHALGAGAGTAGMLNRYEIRAPFDGMVVEKHVALGEAVKEDANIFTISDLSSVWARIDIPSGNLDLVRVGGKVRVKAASFDSTATGTISYVGALIGEQTRTARAQVTLANPGLTWRPGLFVTVELDAGEAEVPVAVTSGGIQDVDGKPAVFVAVPGGFVARPVQTGRANDQYVEVVHGLKAGDRYASSGSFVVKSELGKDSAEHDD